MCTLTCILQIVNLVLLHLLPLVHKQYNNRLFTKDFGGQNWHNKLYLIHTTLSYTILLTIEPPLPFYYLYIKHLQGDLLRQLNIYFLTVHHLYERNS